MVIKRWYGFLILLVLISFVSSEDSIGQRQDAQIGVPYLISQPCASCTYINITILTKNGIVLENAEMINNGSTWIYNFTPTESLRHDVNGIGDKDGSPSSFAYWFVPTLSGQQTNTSIIISDIILLVVVFGLFLIISKYQKETDFDLWNKKIVANGKNKSKTLVNSLLYPLFKNTFIWTYFLGWIFILILKDVVYRFNSTEIYEYFTLISNIYSVGLLLVLVFLIGLAIDYFNRVADFVSDDDWGIDNE